MNKDVRNYVMNKRHTPILNTVAMDNKSVARISINRHTQFANKLLFRKVDHEVYLEA